MENFIKEYVADTLNIFIEEEENEEKAEKYQKNKDKMIEKIVNHIVGCDTIWQQFDEIILEEMKKQGE